MATERLSMRKIHELLRLRWEAKLSQREIARSLAAGKTAVGRCLQRAEEAGLTWPLDPVLDDAALEARLYPHSPAGAEPQPAPDVAYLHRELSRKHMTLALLWREYKDANREDGYQYSQFCAIYHRYRESLDVVLRQEHRAGEKLFVDFSGDGIPITDPDTGEVKEAPLFVAVLGASNYIYAEAFPDQKLRSWIDAHVHAYEYIRGVPKFTVPDNTKTAVRDPCYYDPDLNRTYADLARHYGTTVLPARPVKPRDKAKVEGGVLIAQRWILAELRNHTFFSIAQANEAIRLKLEDLNTRKFQKLDTNRRQMYEQVDRPALKPLPARPYEYAEWSSPTVNIDYHVDVGRHYYSVPFTLARQRVEARQTGTTVEVFFKGARVASHPRNFAAGRHTTAVEHMPKAHQKFLEWTPSRLITWAEKTGPQTGLLAKGILESRPHPEQGYRACLGLFRLARVYGPERMEAASARALTLRALSYRSVESILKTGMDRAPAPRPAAPVPAPLLVHENLRGPAYYKEASPC